MGDRANIYLIDNDPQHGIYLYTHWGGTELPEDLRLALEFGRERWTDPQYLARIIASRVFEGMNNSTTGGGISTVLCDNEHPIIVVDLRERTVAFAAEGQEHDRSRWSVPVDYATYCKQEPADYPIQ